jgi:DNA-binding MarR family transcriptional regulator
VGAEPLSRPWLPHTNSHTRQFGDALQRERPDLDLSDYLYLIYANRVGRVLETVDDRHCRTEFGMSSSDMRVLFALRRAGPSYALRPTELFRALLVTSGAITKQVDRLAAGGYVARQPGPAKSGGYLIHLTAKGFKTADDALTSLVHSAIVSTNTLTAEERNQVCVLLEKMLVDLEARLEASDKSKDDLKAQAA